MLDQKHVPVTVSLDVVWQDSAGKQDARMSEISMQELTLRMVTAIVETEGYEVVPAHDGRQALGILQREAGFSAAISI